MMTTGDDLKKQIADEIHAHAVRVEMEERKALEQRLTRPAELRRRSHEWRDCDDAFLPILALLADERPGEVPLLTPVDFQVIALGIEAAKKRIASEHVRQRAGEPMGVKIGDDLTLETYEHERWGLCYNFGDEYTAIILREPEVRRLYEALGKIIEGMDAHDEGE